MNILYAVLILTVLGGVFGLVLSIASKVFEVKSDPRLAEILDALPGANCGGCGYAGCAGCAAAILEGKAPVNACPSNTGEKTARIAAIMGVEVQPVERRVAFVRCAGGDRAGHKFDKYVGLTDCVAAMKVAGNGTLDCAYGCLGLGSCVKACKFDAIHINARGVAEVDREKCVCCMQCAACARRRSSSACPTTWTSSCPAPTRRRASRPRPTAPSAASAASSASETVPPGPSPCPRTWR